MKRPRALPTVERKISRNASIPAGANVSASGWMDALAAGLGALPGIISKF